MTDKPKKPRPLSKVIATLYKLNEKKYNGLLTLNFLSGKVTHVGRAKCSESYEYKELNSDTVENWFKD